MSLRVANIVVFLSGLKQKLLGGYSILNKLFFVSLIAVAIGWYYFDSIATFLVNDKKVKDTIIKSLSFASGKETSVNGEVVFTTNPEPYVSVKDIIISNSESSTSSANFAEIGEISTKPDLVALTRGKINFDELIIKNTKVFLEQHNSNDHILYNTLQNFFSNKTDYSGKKISFKNLELNFHKKSNIENSQEFIKRKLEFTDLTLDPKPLEGGYTIRGAINFNPTHEVYYFTINFEDGIGIASPVNIRIYSNDTELSFKGKANTQGKIELDGKLEGKISSFSYKLFSALGLSDDVTDSIRLNETAEVSAEISIYEKQISIRSLNAKSEVMDMDISSETEITDKYDTSINFIVNSLDYTKLLKTRKEQIAVRRAGIIEKDFNKRLQNFSLFSMGDDINFTLDINLKNINFFGNRKGNFTARISHKNNLFSVEKFDLNLPGNSIFKILSNIQIDKKYLNLNGELALALYGSRLDELALAFGIIDNPQKTPGLGVFYLKTKGYFSKKKIHFKQILSKVNDNKFAGQMVIDYEKQFAASSAFNFDKLELDRYLIKKDKKEIYQDSFSDNIDFLRFIDSVFDELKIAITATNLTKSGEILKDFALYAQVNPGITKIIDLYFITKEFGEFRGNAVIDINDFQPKVDINIRADTFDIDYMEYGKKIRKNDRYSFKGNWDKSQISFEGLGYLQGKMTLAIDKLRIYNHLLDSFRTSLDLQGANVTINDSKFELFGNKIDFKGDMTTEYPSFKITFISADLDMMDFLKEVFGIKQIYGKFNISGILASTGYSIEQMVKSARGRIEVISNGFKVTGFDLYGLSKNIVDSERMEEAQEIGNEYLNSGETIFGPVKASFGIDDGKLFFSNLDLKIIKLNSQAKSNGSIDLMKWQPDIQTNFDVRTVDGFNMALVLKTTGRVGKHKLTWNEDALVKYWEDKFYGANPEKKRGR